MLIKYRAMIFLHSLLYFVLSLLLFITNFETNSLPLLSETKFKQFINSLKFNTITSGLEHAQTSEQICGVNILVPIDFWLVLGVNTNSVCVTLRGVIFVVNLSSTKFLSSKFYWQRFGLHQFDSRIHNVWLSPASNGKFQSYHLQPLRYTIVKLKMLDL